MHIGIDLITFSTSKYFFKLETLAKYRNVDYAKYCTGIGQTQMSVFPPNEDIITLAVDAAEKLLSNIDNKDSIDMLIFASESSFDISKSEGIYVHKFLELNNECRVFNIKQACYSLTAALEMAKSHVALYPSSKVLIIGSDIIKYPSNSSGEPTQGGGAVAMIVSESPRILELEPYSSVFTKEVMDFWRPIYKSEALFDGKLSAYNYLELLKITFDKYIKKSRLSKKDIDYFCFHCPFCKMAQKVARQIGDIDIHYTTIYNSVIGNSCSASLYISFISLLDNCLNDLTEKRIGFFSYGSGSVAEFFSGKVVPGYKRVLLSQRHKKDLEERIEISFEDYELFRKNTLPSNSKNYVNIGNLTLSNIIDDKRYYSKINKF